MQHLVIVARDRPDLHDELRRRFANNALIDVIFDRRLGERREGAVVRERERRGGDRRQADEDVQPEMWVAGYLIVRKE
jgi:hypothetical protein